MTNICLSTYELKLLRMLLLYDIELSEDIEVDYRDIEEMQQNYTRSVALRKIEKALLGETK